MAAEAIDQRWETIPKDVAAFPVTPNLRDYAQARAGFSWADARRALDGLPGGGLNIAHEAVSRHVAHGRGHQMRVPERNVAGRNSRR